MYNPALEAAELDCLLALYTSDYESHKKRNDPPVEGTCRWFLQHEKYLHWHASNVSELLWLSADPGCGKSVLTSFLPKLGRYLKQNHSMFAMFSSRMTVKIKEQLCLPCLQSYIRFSRVSQG
jgi:hypothetical protein